MEARAFLQSQIRILDTPLELKDPETTPEDDAPIAPDLLLKVNEQVNLAIRRHNKEVYPLDANSKLADKIDVAWILRKAKLPTNDDALDDSPMTLDDNELDAMPEQWPVGGQVRGSGLQSFADSQRYSQLRETLTALQTSHTDKQATVNKLLQLTSSTSALDNPAENLQGELVTRDGEIATEISKMRRLLAQAKGGNFDSAPK